MNLPVIHSCCHLFKKMPLNIGFVGGVRYFDINKKIISAFANNPSFTLSYIGKQHPGCDLPSFCRAYNIKNVSFSRTFQNENKKDIYEGIDLINSIYGDNSIEVCSLLPARLYDAALYQIPILVSKNTYLQTIVEQYHLGLAIDMSTENAVEKLVCYINHFDEDIFYTGCEKFWDTSSKEKNAAMERINEYFKRYVSIGNVVQMEAGRPC